MRAFIPWLLLWPGLSRLWLRGDLRSLGIAIAFAALLNFTLICTHLRPDWVGTPACVLLWVGVVAACAVSVYRGGRATKTGSLRNPLAEGEEAIAERRTSTLRKAQLAYLKGDWLIAEKLLLPLTRIEDTPDHEAKLLLASVFRRNGRRADAEKLLSELTSTGDAYWLREIHLERQMLKDA